MPISPRVDQFMQDPSQDQEQMLFEQGFTDMAQSMLVNKMPEIAGYVITFKIIDSDIENGSAIGAFIAQMPSGVVYVPAILADNQLKPLEVMFLKDKNKFLPLTQEWLAEVEQGSIPAMGDAIRTPETMAGDVDVTNLIVPPYTGRYSYASVQDELHLPEALSNAENSVKKKFASLLKKDAVLLKTAVAIYGKDVIIDALRPRSESVKVAEVNEGELYVATRDTEAKELKDAFGPHSPNAMKDIARKGYASKDTRKDLYKPIDVAEVGPYKAQEVSASGFYKMFMTDGTKKSAIAVINPLMFSNKPHYDLYGSASRTNFHTRKTMPRGDDAMAHRPNNSTMGSLVFFDDGRVLFKDRLEQGDIVPMGEVTDANKVSGKVFVALTERPRAPKAGEKGFFLRVVGSNISATEIVHVDTTSTDSKGVRRVKARTGQYGYHPMVFIMDDKDRSGRIVLPPDESVAMIPSNYTFVPVTDFVEKHEIVNGPKGLHEMALIKLTKGETKEAAVKSFRNDEYSINGGSALHKFDATMKIASDLHVSMDDAEMVLKTAHMKGSVRVLAAPVSSLIKVAEGFPPQDPNAQPPQDPNAQPQDPSMGDPETEAQLSDPTAMAAMAQDPNALQPQPPMPSPVDMAVQELQEEVANAAEQEMMLLHQRQMSLMQQLQALQAVAARAAEIEQGIPKEQSQALMASTQPGADVGGGAMGQDGMDPGMAQGMDPGMAQGMDPSAGQAPMQGPAMGPGLMQQGAQVGDPRAFDAGALGTLAEMASLKDLVASYTPTLEKSVDHLGRILMTLWMKGSQLKAELGEENYSTLEDRLRNIFRGMGDLVLRVGQNSATLSDGAADEHSNEITGL